MINGTCHRRAFLSYLGEGKLPLGAEVLRAPPDQCCSRCNPTTELTRAPDLPQPLVQPQAGTQAAIALSLLNKWAVVQAESVYESAN